MNFIRIALPALALCLGTTSLSASSAYGVPSGSHDPSYGQDRDGQDMGPRRGNKIQQRGFQDGMDGARKDVDNHRRPDPNNRDEYRHPNVPYELRGQYRDAFRHGYQQAVSQINGGGPGPQMHEPDRGGRDMGPGSEIQQRGFQDGMDGARKDMGNHRRPDPSNRDEYRHPNVPYELQGQYRDAFRRGYRQAMSQMGRPR